MTGEESIEFDIHNVMKVVKISFENSAIKFELRTSYEFNGLKKKVRWAVYQVYVLKMCFFFKINI